MTQLRRHSLLEAVINTAVGYLLSILTQMIVFPWLGIVTTSRENFAIATIFTVISLLRSYACRRLFNHFTKGQ